MTPTSVMTYILCTYSKYQTNKHLYCIIISEFSWSKINVTVQYIFHAEISSIMQYCRTCSNLKNTDSECFFPLKIHRTTDATERAICTQFKHKTENTHTHTQHNHIIIHSPDKANLFEYLVLCRHKQNNDAVHNHCSWTTYSSYTWLSQRTKEAPDDQRQEKIIPSLLS